MSAEQVRAARSGHRWPINAIRGWVASWPLRSVKYPAGSVYMSGWCILTSSAPVTWAYRYWRSR